MVDDSGAGCDSVLLACLDRGASLMLTRYWETDRGLVGLALLAKSWTRRYMVVWASGRKLLVPKPACWSVL